MISPGRMLYLLRRDFQRGWDASYHDYRTLPLIESWEWAFWGEDPHEIPVHVLTGAKDWRLAAWMLASWFHFTDLGWKIVVHDDGTLPDEAAETIQRIFRTARVIPRYEADLALSKALMPFPFCLDYRREHPLATKVFDMAHFADGERYLIFDSDVLFFRTPREILAWANDPGATECWFNEDVREASNVSATEAMDELGVRLWPRVNSGLCLMRKSAIDFDFCDRALAETSIRRGHVWRVEQTLFALCAARYGKGGLLPKRYEVSLGKHAVAPDLVSRHYVGAVRDRFFGEGLKRLREELFAVEAE